MNTKLSIALLSGLSFFMSVAAFAVADEKSEDYLNWSYAMGEMPQNITQENANAIAPIVLDTTNRPTCTEGCAGRPATGVEPVELTLTYEGDAAPIADQAEETTVANVLPSVVNVKKKSTAYSMPATSWQEENYSEPVVQKNADVVEYQTETQVETRYVTTPAKVEYPVTRQYPVSVQYPVTVQRNMTVEQPVIMQQPVIVRRPVVMQQDITVQRQPTVIQNQPVVMNQQPTVVQQQPMYIQAPAQPISPAMMSQIIPQAIPTNLPQQIMPQQPMIMSAQPMSFPQPAVMNAVQQYQIQGQVQAQPVYMMPDLSYAAQSSMPSVVQPTAQVAPQVAPQAYPNPVQQ